MHVHAYHNASIVVRRAGTGDALLSVPFGERSPVTPRNRAHKDPTCRKGALLSNHGPIRTAGKQRVVRRDGRKGRKGIGAEKK